MPSSASGARLIGLNNRDLRSLEVDTERAERLRDRIPDDRIVIAESGVRDASTVARWRALGFDAALVGEALMRSGDPAAAARSFVAAGAQPDDPANVARRPFVKICGVTDADGALAAVRAGADAIGLNVVPGTPRERSLDEAASLADLIRGRRRLDAAPASWPSPPTLTPPRSPRSSRRSIPMPSRTAARDRWRRPPPANGRGGRRSTSPRAADAAERDRVISGCPRHPGRRCPSGCCSTRPAACIRAGPACAPMPRWPRWWRARCRSPWPAA